ncbi:unnamed protein product [Phytophthora fragariaefolia]|uniref:Unnamed protein product n=1 Tax=Phytophthora fragariaefolia TaxID=1490495 RepID=A0A9W6U449_9STRA|nr:unnamed protein product [Phytophthora fragariaefolia]
MTRFGIFISCEHTLGQDVLLHTHGERDVVVTQHNLQLLPSDTVWLGPFLVVFSVKVQQNIYTSEFGVSRSTNNNNHLRNNIPYFVISLSLMIRLTSSMTDWDTVTARRAKPAQAPEPRQHSLEWTMHSHTADIAKTFIASSSMPIHLSSPTERRVTIKVETASFGVDAVNASITPTSLHDDFVNMMKTQGLEKMATEAGLLRNGALVESLQQATPSSAANTPVKCAAGKNPVLASAPLLSPSFTTPYAYIFKKPSYPEVGSDCSVLTLIVLHLFTVRQERRENT